MKCKMCKKLIVDDHFIMRKKHFFHLDECWWKAKKFYSVVVPSIFGLALIFGIVVLILGLVYGIDINWRT